MISKIPEFIEWKSKIDGDMEGVKCIIAESLTDECVKDFTDICAPWTRDINADVSFALNFKIAIDNYLESEGWYKLMEEDKEADEEGDQAILDEEQSIRYGARSPL